MIKLESYLFPKKSVGGLGGSQLDAEARDLIKVLTTFLITVTKYPAGSSLREGEFNVAHSLSVLPAW